KRLTPEERYRQKLGLPLERRLSEAEIHRAYKLLAKRAHPDAGGNAEAFLRISAAHDVLMKERRIPSRYR
ncbi:MAG: DnaJ domain-containing protein, partial [Bradyrhizobium sp.]